MDNCQLCEIVTGETDFILAEDWPDAVAVYAQEPEVEGTIIVIAKEHLRDFTSDPVLAGELMRCVSEIAPFPSSVITSAGRPAGQGDFHLHFEIIPGVKMPERKH